MTGPTDRARVAFRTIPRFATCLLVLSAPTALAADLPTPEAHLGFRPGADGRLATWDQVVRYVKTVGDGSDRVDVRTLGETTEGRPYVCALISSPETLRDLERFRNLQSRLADPRAFADAAEADRALAESKAVVVITCSIHSSETASTLMALELLYELATREDPKTRAVLDATIVILVPSANPDGVDKVAAWYERSKGHPWEGSGMPELYHKYAGHDTNRDWFMLNLKETRLLSRLLYREWFPTLLYDVHQMGRAGARMFVPPFHDPINPNLDPRMHQAIFTIGAHMAGDLAAAGKKGVLTGGLYDNWWNGGNRTTPQRHNVVGVLTEAASVRMASPIFIEKDDLKAGGRGFPDHKPSVHFVDPWPGGMWTLRDIIDYELICARSLLTLASRYRDHFQANLLAMARDAVKKGQTEPPHAWIVPLDQRDPGTAATLIRAMLDTGVEVRSSSEAFTASGETFPPGSWVIPAAQPYRPHVKDMMERQVYPTRLTAGGRAESPYDVAGWTLPLQMGVRVVEAAAPISVKGERIESADGPKGKIDGPPDAGYYRLANRSNDDFILLNGLAAASIAVERGLSEKGETPLLFKATEESRAVLDRVLPTLSCRVTATRDAPAPASPSRRGPFGDRLSARVALYQPWVPSMDEGWTRLVLERFAFPYTSVHNADVRAGRLRDRFDVVLFASIDPKTLRSGYEPDETEPAYVGGLGPEGLDALRAFLKDGGRLVFLGASCDYAIESLGLPVKNVLKGRPSSEFYAPGSLLRANVDTKIGLAAGAPETVSVYVDQPAAFESTATTGVQQIVRYATPGPLESGWLLGPERLEGKGAMVAVGVEKGTVVLFGFRPQHRGQTHGTFRLLFNTLLNL